MFVNLPFIIFAPFRAYEEITSMQTTEILIPNSITTILYYIMSLKTSSKSFNRCRMQLPDWLHDLGSVITSLPSSSIFTGYLFLNELIFFEPFRISKTLRRLVVCGVENVIVIKIEFCCLADAVVLKFTIYTPISGFCGKENDFCKTGVHKSSPIRSKRMAYWPM